MATLFNSVPKTETPKKKKKMEFSKKILIVVSIFNIIVVLFSIYMIWKTENLEPLAYLIPSTFAELATATGAYYSKAKVENRIKLKAAFKIPLKDDDFDEKPKNDWSE